MLYKIFCIIPGGDPAFMIKLNDTDTVEELKQAIKACDPRLSKYSASDLTLFKIDVPISNKAKYIKEVGVIYQRLSSLEELEVADELKEVFATSSRRTASGPPPGKVHILVHLPIAVPNTIANTDSIDPQLIFKSRQTGTEHFNWQTLEDNTIWEQVDGAPEFILLIQKKLREKRSMSAEQQDHFKYFLEADLDGNFDVVDHDEVCSKNELIFYASLSLGLSVASASDGFMAKHRIGGDYFRHIASYLCKVYSDKPDFKREAHWSFALVGQVGGSDGSHYSYRPKNDYMFLLNGYPLIIIEICSKDNESDRFRMLLQGSLLVRVMNSIKSTGTFVAMAIYIKNDFVAKRYLIYQLDRKKPDIEFIVEDFDLKTSTGAFEFFFQLHNLPMAFPPDGELSTTSAQLSSLNKIVAGKGLPEFTAKQSARRKLKSNAPPGDNTNPFGNPSIVQQVSDAGYELLLPVEGWIPLEPLPSTLSWAIRPTGDVVILKLVDQDEFSIHSFLNTLKAKQNHAIPILDVISLDPEKLIVLRKERVLQDVPDSVLKTMGHSLAFQFLEGVRFLHEHKVAHLDLKPPNIVITATKRLQIIDFSVSVVVSDLESWMVGYRGTEGWAAPELENDPDGEFQPIRADLWSSGRVLEYLSQRAGGTIGFEVIMRQLLHHDPQKRPYLSEVLQDTSLVTPKRKLSVGVVKEGDKRRCI